MSTRSTIFLTNDNEHWYRDCGYEKNNKGEYVTDFIDMEMDKKNVSVIYNDEDSLMIRVFPDCDLHRHIMHADSSSREYKLRNVCRELLAELSKVGIDGKLLGKAQDAIDESVLFS